MNETPFPPPYDLNAEKALLGACIRDNRLIDEITPILQTSDFHGYAHQLLFAAVTTLWKKQAPPDFYTLGQYLGSRKTRESTEFEEVGGAVYLLELLDQNIVVGNAPYYAEIVRKKAIYRELIRLGADMATNAQNQNGKPEEVMAMAQEGIWRIQQRQFGSGPVHIGEAITEALETIDKRRNGGGTDGEHFEAIPTGWRSLDNLIVGFHKSELALIAARPSVGKTLVAGNIIANVSTRSIKTFFASLEQPNRELGIRWLSLLGKVDSFRTRSGTIDADDTERLLAASSIARDWKVWIDDKPSQTMSRILANARRIQHREGLDMVVIDYLQIASPEHDGKRYDQVSQIARDAKQMARVLDVPVIALAQLNREGDKRGDTRPKLSDLRESGWLEQEADTVILLHKPVIDDHNDNEVIEAIVAKQRNGPRGTISLMHNKRFFEVRSLTPGEYATST